jgi:hypothetical protein
MKAEERHLNVHFLAHFPPEADLPLAGTATLRRIHLNDSLATTNAVSSKQVG